MSGYDRVRRMLKTASLLAGGLLLLACSDSDFSFDDQNPFTKPDALIEIHTPENGSVLPANTPFILEYGVVRGVKGKYVKIRIDNRPPVKVDSLNSKHHIEGLPAGQHRISIFEFDENGKFTGGMSEIHIHMQ